MGRLVSAAAVLLSAAILICGAATVEGKGYWASKLTLRKKIYQDTPYGNEISQYISVTTTPN